MTTATAAVLPPLVADEKKCHAGLAPASMVVHETATEFRPFADDFVDARA